MKRKQAKNQVKKRRKVKLDMPKTEEEWEGKLDSEQFRVLRQKGTEMPFTGKLLYNKEKGVYVCVGCGNKIFRSETKFESGTGWPSFYNAIKDSIKLNEDYNLPLKRTEVLCSRCGGHLGHVFDDGPKPTGKRYCINNIALDFKRSKG